MQNTFLNPVAIQIPSDARAYGFYATTQLADAYAISLPTDAVTEPEALARFMFESQPVWAKKLMQMRDAIVSIFGLKTAKQLVEPAAQTVNASQVAEKRIAIFKIYGSNAHEVFLGEDDSHLDFRISVQVRPASPSGGPQFIVSTVVQCNNLLGRAYITIIAPFHRTIVKAAMKRAATRGWPKIDFA
jgi:Protein of unknown function (DUF2867)